MPKLANWRKLGHYRIDEGFERSENSVFCTGIPGHYPRVYSGYGQFFVCWAFFSVPTCRVRSRAETWGIVLYICPSISLSWETMGAKSCVRVFTDFSKMAHTAWGRTRGQSYCTISEGVPFHFFNIKAQLGLNMMVTHLYNLRVVEPLTK